MLLVFGTATAADPPKIPAIPPNPVVDLAGIIDNNVETKLNRYLRELEEKTSAQMVVLTIKSLQGQALEEFSITIAHDKWKLGQKGKDNGVLMVVALNDKKYRFEIGYGLEGVLPDSLVGTIGRKFLVPYFKKGDYSTGIYAAAVVIANEIARDADVEITGMPAVKTAYPAKKRTGSTSIIGKIFTLLFFLIMIIAFIKNPRFFLAFSRNRSISSCALFWASCSFSSVTIAHGCVMRHVSLPLRGGSGYALGSYTVYPRNSWGVSW